MKVTKSFVKMWVSQMLTNKAFIHDSRVNGTNVGEASQGDLKKLKEILVIFADHVDHPKPPIGGSMAQHAPEKKEREMLRIVSEPERRQSILDFIALIDAGEVTVT